MRIDVRHSRDCPLCKCSNIYLYKFQLQEKADIAVYRSPGNTSSDKFFCEVCLAPDGQRCQIICTKRIDGGRCWPTLHKGKIKEVKQ